MTESAAVDAGRLNKTYPPEAKIIRAKGRLLQAANLQRLQNDMNC